jgi:hypothetical protein
MASLSMPEATITDETQSVRTDPYDQLPRDRQPTLVTIQYTVQLSTRQQLRFEWRTNGPGWWRIKNEWTNVTGDQTGGRLLWR